MKTIIVIGGGPSGMMAAISSKTHNNCKVILLERNKKLGTKMVLTGGGRCNVTANVDNQMIIENTPKNGKFLYSSLINFNSKDIQNFFNKEGCPLKEEDHNRVFPKSNKSIDIVNTLNKKLVELGVDIYYEQYVVDIDFKTKQVITNNLKLNYDYLIIATGGKTFPHTGSDGNGYELAKKVGHTITSLLPAEVPLVSNDLLIQEKILQGLSFKDIVINILDKNKIKKSITHDLIFTHFGLSGPAALRASFYVQKILEKSELVELNIDFLPNIKNDELLENQLIIFEFLFECGLPKRLIDCLKNKTTNIDELIKLVKRFPLTVYTTRGFSQAFVTNGGIAIKEIDPKTMKSKLNNTISFCGEIIDISSFTGGYNITSALSTGFTAGKYVIDY